MAGRFTHRVEFWTTEEQAERIARWNDGGLLSKADKLRLGCDLVDQHFANANGGERPAQSNGAHHPAGAGQ
jgi:hypothetical protein